MSQKIKIGMNILVTAFETFNPPMNVSEVIVQEFSKLNQDIQNVNLKIQIIPCESVKILQIVQNFFCVEYDVIILTGESAFQNTPCLERFALNICDFSIPDNLGLKLNGIAILPSGPVAYQTNFLDLDGLLASIKNNLGKDLQISNHAGAFLCNQIYYETLNFISVHELKTEVIFLHLPKSAFANNFSFKIADGVELLNKIIEFVVNRKLILLDK